MTPVSNSPKRISKNNKYLIKRLNMSINDITRHANKNDYNDNNLKKNQSGGGACVRIFYQGDIYRSIFPL